jgi:hypothetical protein
MARRGECNINTSSFPRNTEMERKMDGKEVVNDDSRNIF